MSGGLAPLRADCHVHLFDPERFPYGPDAHSTPAPHETAPLSLLLEVMAAQGVTHAVIVTPTSGYGTDNSAAIAALAAHPDRLRGIAVVDPDTGEAHLAALKAAGFAGVRVDLMPVEAVDFEACFGRLADRLRDLGMLMQIQAEARHLPAVAETLRRRNGRVIFDHMGRPDPRDGTDQAGFQALLALADRPGTYVKLSGPFRFSEGPYPFRDADPFAAAILAAFGGARCVWGSDWPFVHMPMRLDYGPSLAALSRWVEDDTTRRQILWETPKAVFGFVEPVDLRSVTC